MHAANKFPEARATRFALSDGILADAVIAVESDFNRRDLGRLQSAESQARDEPASSSPPNAVVGDHGLVGPLKSRDGVFSVAACILATNTVRFFAPLEGR